MPDNRQICGNCQQPYGEEWCPTCGCEEKKAPEQHLTVKKLKDVLAQLPEDYVVCMSADVPNGYVIGGTHYKVDQMSKAVFIIDVTSQPEKEDVAF